MLWDALVEDESLEEMKVGIVVVLFLMQCLFAPIIKQHTELYC